MKPSSRPHYLVLILPCLAGCANYKLESLHSRGTLPDPTPIFIHSGNAESYQASAAVTTRTHIAHSLELVDTLKFDTSGLVMEYPRQRERAISNRSIFVRDSRVMISASMVRRYRILYWSASMDADPTDMDYMNLGFQAGISGGISDIVGTIAAGWIGNRTRAYGVYHVNSPSHTDLEGVYFRHGLDGKSWGSSWMIAGGFLLATRRNIDPYVSYALFVYDLYPNDGPQINDFGLRLSTWKAGLIWEAAKCLSVDFSLALRAADHSSESPTGFQAGLSGGWRFGPLRLKRNNLALNPK